MSPATQVRAPAKVNLGLRIVARRPDGYHELESLFAPLDLADELRIEVSPAAAVQVSLRVDGEATGVPADASNLAARAAQAFLEAAGLRVAVSLQLTKRVPAAAGLGGGSSDAGAVLRGLAELLSDAPPAGRLAELALGLGADVPFFLDPTPARVSGIGDRIEPLQGLPPLALLLANPGTPLSTAEVYRSFDALQPTLPAAAAGPTLRRPPQAPLPGLPGVCLSNDLEAAAVKLCPSIAKLQQRLWQTDPLGVGLSGSGPTVFAVYPTGADAAAARDRLGFRAPVWCRVAFVAGSG